MSQGPLYPDSIMMRQHQSQEEHDEDNGWGAGGKKEEGMDH